MERVIFVADIFRPFSAKSSTQLVIYSVLFALKQKYPTLFFVGLYYKEDDKKEIEKFLINEHIEFLLIKAKINMEKKNKFLTLFYLYRALSINHKNEIKTINIDRFDRHSKIILSVPSIESFSIAKYLSKRIHSTILNTIWTDVIVLNSLDNYNRIPLWRSLMIPIEKRILNASSSNFFLGEQQFKVMRSFYKKVKTKMDFYYPSYYPFFSYFDKRLVEVENNKIALYFGDLNPLIRDICPLYLASNFTTATIRILGKGKLSLKGIEKAKAEYVPLDSRITTLSEALRIEKESFISVCVLNKHGFSLPGKLFYYTKIHRPILVIKDGPFGNDIENQLKPFNRFIFCENKPESIANSINNILNSKSTNFNYEAFSPDKTYKKIIG